MSDPHAGGGHGNKGLDMAKAAFAILLAVGIGLFVAGMGLGALGGGVGEFIRNIGGAMAQYPVMSIIFAIAGLGIVAGTLIMAIKAVKDS